MAPHESDEPGSFRDPASSVFYVEDRVLRGFTGRGATDWEAVAGSAFFGRLLADQSVVGTRPVDAAIVSQARRDRFETFVEHDRIPFISYPYEWSFSMLQDAAALHCEILLAALAEDFTMKDGYSYNVQFVGPQPCFIDVGSFEPVTTWGPWHGYRQFCQSFLFPLMLQSYKDVSFQPFLRGQINGITPSQMRAVLDGRKTFRKGVFTNVTLHAALEKRYSSAETQTTEKEVRNAGFGKAQQVALATKLLKTIKSLKWKRSNSTWSSYGTTCSYDDENRAFKADFVRRAASARRRSMSWDLGCNEGTYSRIAAESSDYVLAADVDDLVIDRLYRTLRKEGATKILPLVIDLVDPSPGLGWSNRERQPFDQRRQPELVLALALVHHLAIGSNIPLAEIVRWFRSLNAEIVVEFVDRDDPLAHHLLQNKPPHTHDSYNLANFSALVGESFDVVERSQLPLETRTLFHFKPR